MFLDEEDDLIPAVFPEDTVPLFMVPDLTAPLDEVDPLIFEELTEDRPAIPEE
jgi:hypothetical protein